MITTANFASGEYQITGTTNTTAELQAAITRWEGYYMTNLFGGALYELYIAGIAAIPPETRFVRVRDAFHLQEDDGGKFHHSEGLVVMLKALIYAEFILQNRGIKIGVNGAVSFEAEAASRTPYLTIQHIAKTAYNRGVDTYKAIRWRMKSSDIEDAAVIDSEDFPEFTGIKLDYMTHFGK